MKDDRLWAEDYGCLMKERGNEGWELVSVLVHKGELSKYTGEKLRYYDLFWKRPVEE